VCCWSFILRVKAGCETLQIALHIAPKLTILGWKCQKNFWGGGIASSPDPSPSGEGTPPPHTLPPSAPAPRFLRLRRSAFPHLFSYKLTTACRAFRVYPYPRVNLTRPVIVTGRIGSGTFATGTGIPGRTREFLCFQPLFRTGPWSFSKLLGRQLPAAFLQYQRVRTKPRDHSVQQVTSSPTYALHWSLTTWTNWCRWDHSINRQIQMTARMIRKQTLMSKQVSE